jgi:hypothetical protein
MSRVLRIAFLTLWTLILVRPSFGQISITVAFPPPAPPIYELPPCPAEGVFVLAPDEPFEVDPQITSRDCMKFNVANGVGGRLDYAV